jgi:hypothetical protein
MPSRSSERASRAQPELAVDEHEGLVDAALAHDLAQRAALVVVVTL